MVRDGHVMENAGVVASLRPAPLSDLWPSSDDETDEAAS